MRRIGSILALTLTLALIPITAHAAGGRFSDDDFSVHEADIEALAHAGITQGCAPTLFCPEQAVTRGQRDAGCTTQRSMAFLEPGGAAGDRPNGRPLR